MVRSTRPHSNKSFYSSYLLDDGSAYCVVNMSLLFSMSLLDSYFLRQMVVRRSLVVMIDLGIPSNSFFNARAISVCPQRLVRS